MITEENKSKQSEEAKRYRLVVRSAEEAVRMIREKLGDHAKVVSVRQIGGEGLKRFISSPKLEVIAEVSNPEDTLPFDSSSPAPVAAPELPARDPEQKKDHREITGKVDLTTVSKSSPAEDLSQSADGGSALSLLAKAGFDEQLLSEMKSWPDLENVENLSLADVLRKVTLTLTDRFRSIPSRPIGNKIALLGSPGSGKTTMLCKLLAHEVFIKKKLPMVLKLENGVPNPDDSLRIFCEVIGVTLFRDPKKVPPASVDSPLFIDIPGVSLNDVGEWSFLNSALNDLGVSTRLLILNGAYETKVLAKCIRIGANLASTHLAVSHFDELSNASKLWPIIFDSGLSPYCISTGQNVTGDFSSNVLNQMISKSFPENLYAQSFSSYPS
jgi:flagellar biosynthesis protein FlhF